MRAFLGGRQANERFFGLAMPSRASIISFVTTAAASLALIVPCLVLWRSGDAGFAPMAFLFSGRLLVDRPLIVGGALDQPSLHKEWFVLCYSLVIIAPCLAGVRWLTRGHRRPLQVVWAIASSILLLHPVSILTIFCYDVSRYILAMGVTPRRLVGVGLSCVTYIVLGVFAAWLWRCSIRWPNRLHVDR